MSEPSPDALQRLLDLEAIRDLARRYAHCIWRKDADGAAALFADDGAMDTGDRPPLVGPRGDPRRLPRDPARLRPPALRARPPGRAARRPGDRQLSSRPAHDAGRPAPPGGGLLRRPLRARRRPLEVRLAPAHDALSRPVPRRPGRGRDHDERLGPRRGASIRWRQDHGSAQDRNPTEERGVQHAGDGGRRSGRGRRPRLRRTSHDRRGGDSAGGRRDLAGRREGHAARQALRDRRRQARAALHQAGRGLARRRRRGAGAEGSEAPSRRRTEP